MDGLASSSNVGGAAQVSTRGPLTAATNVTTSGVLDLFAHDTAAPGDNLTVLGGVTVQSTGDTVHLAGGDDVVVQAGATIQSAGTFFANVDADNAEGFFGGTATLNGTFVAPDTRIRGHFDNDTLNGTPLVDSLEGGLGADTMRGGAGNDTYFVDGGDAVIENAGKGTDTVRSIDPLRAAGERGKPDPAGRLRRPAGLRQRPGRTRSPATPAPICWTAAPAPTS